MISTVQSIMSISCG